MPNARAHPLAMVVLLAVIGAGQAHAHDPAARLNAAKRNDSFSQSQTIKPEVKDIERDQAVQDRRFDRGETREKSQAPVADKRAPIDLKESREKTLINPERKTYDTLTYDKDLYQNQRSTRFDTGEQAYRTSVADRYQQRLVEAEEDAPKTIVKKRTTFDVVNRFIFRRNRPEGDELLSTAGSAPADTATTAQP